MASARDSLIITFDAVFVRNENFSNFNALFYNLYACWKRLQMEKGSVQKFEPFLSRFGSCSDLKVVQQIF